MHWRRPLLCGVALVTLGALLPRAVALAQTAQVTGTIVNATASAPVPQVFVQNTRYSPYPSTCTGACGHYTLWAQPSSSNGYVVWHPGYFSPARWKNSVGKGPSSTGARTADR